MLKLNGKKVWSLGKLKAAARKEIKKAAEAAAKKAAATAAEIPKEIPEVKDRVIDHKKISLNPFGFMKSVAVANVAQCCNCNQVSHNAQDHIQFHFGHPNEYIYQCPHCGKTSFIEINKDNACFFPTFVTVKTYASHKKVVNCFGEQWVVYYKNGRSFLAKNKGVGQIIFAASGQTYVRPFRDLKSGRTLHSVSGTATKFEAKRFENITFSPENGFRYHYLMKEHVLGETENGMPIVVGKKYVVHQDKYYDFYSDFVSILERKGILKEESKLANRFRYLSYYHIDDLAELRDATYGIMVDWNTNKYLWDVLKRKIGTLPVDITSEDLIAKTKKYFGYYAGDETIARIIEAMPFYSMAVMFLFKKTYIRDIDTLKALLNGLPGNVFSQLIKGKRFTGYSEPW